MVVAGLVLPLACTPPRAITIPEEDPCFGGGFIGPRRSLNQDPSPIRVQTELVDRQSAERRQTRTVTLEREESGTNVKLRAVGRLDRNHFLALGDDGTALARIPGIGWRRERT